MSFSSPFSTSADAAIILGITYILFQRKPSKKAPPAAADLADLADPADPADPAANDPADPAPDDQPGHRFLDFASNLSSQSASYCPLQRGSDGFSDHFMY